MKLVCGLLTGDSSQRCCGSRALNDRSGENGGSGRGARGRGHGRCCRGVGDSESRGVWGTLLDPAGVLRSQTFVTFPEPGFLGLGVDRTALDDSTLELGGGGPTGEYFTLLQSKCVEDPADNVCEVLELLLKGWRYGGRLRVPLRRGLRARCSALDSACGNHSWHIFGRSVSPNWVLDPGVGRSWINSVSRVEVPARHGHRASSCRPRHQRCLCLRRTDNRCECSLNSDSRCHCLGLLAIEKVSQGIKQVIFDV